MTPDRWRLVEDIFQAAVLLPAEEQPAFLDKACHDDRALWKEVHSLLAHADGGTEIECVVQEVAGRLSEDEAASLTGRRIGLYRITGVIARGGVGVVCAAVRDDDQFSKQVAIKLIKRGMDSAFILGRFRAERQILAGLEHSGIARLIDGGVTDDGQPYFVMEHVEGLPITEHCDVNRLTVAERLRLFCSVCGAVQYAHRNLVIHRDIKPSNILVAKDGSPKLLDFGLAKVLTPAPGASTFTALDVRMLTPDYASPEQVKGERVTTATDIYSLGAVLFEMLAGERPHRLKDYTPAEIERAVCQTEIEKPSSIVLRGTSRQRARQLKGDLDNIVLKAMHKAPERRYSSVEQLSQDIERYLEGRPVGARPDTFSYRARKFVGRHKLPVAASGLAVASLVAGAIATAHQARRAEQRFQQVRKLANVFLFDLHDRLRNLPGSTETRRFVVQTGLDYLAGLEPEARGNIELLHELARAYHRIGDVQGHPLKSNLGDPAGAMSSYRKAAAILENLPEHRDRQGLILQAETYTKIGDLHTVRSDWKGGLESQRKALAIVEGLASDGLDEVRLLEVNGLVRQRIASALRGLTDLTGSIEHASKSVALYQKLAGIDSANQLYQERLAESYNLWGNGLEYSGGHREALSHYREVLRIREALAAREPANREYQRDLMMAHTAVGDLLRNPLRGPLDWEGALSHYRKRLEMAELLVRQDSHDKRALLDLSGGLWRVGTCLRALDRFEEALPQLRRGLGITLQALTAEPNAHMLRSNAVSIRHEIARALVGQGKFSEALAHSRAAVESGERLLAETQGGRAVPSRNLLSCYANHVRVLGRLGKADEVKASSRRILELAAETHPKRSSGELVIFAAPNALSAVGEAYESLAGHAENHSARLARQEACSWFGRSLERWDELRNAGSASGLFETGPAEVKKKLAGCEAKVSGSRAAR